MKNVSKLNLSPEMVEKQTRFLTLLAKLIRAYGVLGFAVCAILGTAVLFGDSSSAVDEYGNSTDDTLIRGMAVMLGGVSNGAICIVLASLFDSLRITAVNSARAASLVAVTS